MTKARIEPKSFGYKSYIVDIRFVFVRRVGLYGRGALSIVLKFGDFLLGL